MTDAPEDKAARRTTALWQAVARSLDKTAREVAESTKTTLGAESACRIAELAAAAYWQASGADECNTMPQLLRPKHSETENG